MKENIMKVKTFLVLASILTAMIAVSSKSVAQEQQQQPKKKGLIQEVSGQGYGTAGCGLGSILFGEQEGMVQVFASTTNGIYGNNTFSASSGTSNCTPQGRGGRAATVFIESNRLAMENDIARGSGETLASFFHLVNCSSPDVVGHELQKNYDVIFQKGASEDQVLDSIRNVIEGNQSTAHACTTLG
jgi:hypothetical protein